MPGKCYFSGEPVEEGDDCCADDEEVCVGAECNDYSEPSEDDPREDR